MGKRIGSKNGIITSIKKSVTIEKELHDVILILMEEDNISSYSGMVNRLIRDGVAFRFFERAGKDDS